MTDKTIKIVDVTTGEEIERPMTEEEIAQSEQDSKNFLAEKKALAEREAARQSALAKLAELGLTETEIQALAG